ncbi:hypothetical protein Ct61P_13900 [Colletotrichum tofieldiae]|nr:hypothetical protein Ct61P_13900 [Colletotrichum tofieldiae]
MRFLATLALFCSMALGAPYPSPDIAAKVGSEQPSQRAAKEVASTAAVFKVEKLYAGGRSQSEWN